MVQSWAVFNRGIWHLICLHSWISYLEPRSFKISTVKLDTFNIKSTHLCWSAICNSQTSGGFLDKSSWDGSGHKIHQRLQHIHPPHINSWKTRSIAEQTHSTVTFHPSSPAVSLPPSLSRQPVLHSHSGVYSPLCSPRPPSAPWPQCHFQYIDTSDMLQAAFSPYMFGFLPGSQTEGSCFINILLY